MKVSFDRATNSLLSEIYVNTVGLKRKGYSGMLRIMYVFVPWLLTAKTIKKIRENSNGGNNDLVIELRKKLEGKTVDIRFQIIEMCTVKVIRTNEIFHV